MSLWAHLKSATSLVVIASNLALWALPLAMLGLAKLAMPVWRENFERSMAWIYRAAVVVDDWWLGRVMGIRWNHPQLELDRGRSYLVLANHSSWSDVLLIQSVIVGQGPLIKFLAKRELVFVPILGLVFWAFDFPLLRRRSRSGENDADRRLADGEAIREACRVVMKSPAALMNFVEGTRFTEEKREVTGSPYRHLLRPRVGGFLTLAEALEGRVDALIDLTLVYPRPTSFWCFLSGQLAEIEIRASKVDVKTLPRTPEAAREWLDRRWAEKDAAIESARAAERACEDPS